MITQWYKLKDEKDFQEFFLSQKNRNYKIISTNYSKIYQTEKNKYIFSGGYVGLGLINIMTKVKIDINKNLKEGKFELKDVRPEFFNYNHKAFDSEEGNFFYTSEIDLNSAYLESAYYQKIISQPIYEKLKSVNKKTRLRALGAIATKKHIFTYENGNLVNKEYKTDQKLNKVWNMICKGCDEMIYSLIELYKKQYLFYWFDNLFVNSIKQYKDTLYKYKYPIGLSYSKGAKNIKIMVRDQKRFFYLPK